MPDSAEIRKRKTSWYSDDDRTIPKDGLFLTIERLSIEARWSRAIVLMNDGAVIVVRHDPNYSVAL